MDQFSIMLAESRSAFRLEHQRDPLPGEQAAVDHWLSGGTMQPWDWEEWRSWLDLAWRHSSSGGEISRVRLVDDPPTVYQRWAMSITPWHEDSGDHIRYMPRAMAEQLSVPVANWWLFDDSAVILMEYDGGEVPRKTFVTDPEVIVSYARWRDLALAHASPAEVITA